MNPNASWHGDYKSSNWIFVGGLDYRLTEGDILTVFAQWGAIREIVLAREAAESGRSKGFAFICYCNQLSTVLAVDNFNGIELLGRSLKVDHSHSQGPRNAKGGRISVEKKFPWKIHSQEQEFFNWKGLEFVGARKIAEIGNKCFFLKQDPFNLCFKEFCLLDCDGERNQEFLLLKEHSFPIILTAYKSTDAKKIIVTRRAANGNICIYEVRGRELKMILRAENEKEFFNVDHFDGKWIMTSNSGRFGDGNSGEKECIWQMENDTWKLIYAPSEHEELVEAIAKEDGRIIFDESTNKSKLEIQGVSIELSSVASCVEIGKKFVFESTATQSLVYSKKSGKLKEKHDFFGGKFVQKTIFTQYNAIPITIIYAKEAHKLNEFVLVDVYGSYGEIPRISITPFIKVLLENGFTFAFVHVRGGREKGWKWQGKGKTDSIKDAVEAIRYLIDKQIAKEGKICIHGFSAGAVVAANAFLAWKSAFFACIFDRPLLDVKSLKQNCKLIPLCCSDVEEFDEDSCPMEKLKCTTTTGNDAHIMTNVMLQDERVPFWNPLRWYLQSKRMRFRNSKLFVNVNAGHFPDERENDQKKAKFVLQAAAKWHTESK